MSFTVGRDELPPFAADVFAFLARAPSTICDTLASYSDRTYILAFVASSVDVFDVLYNNVFS